MKRFACIYVWLLCLVLSVAAQEKIVKSENCTDK